MRVCIFGDARSVHVQRLVGGLAARGVSLHVVTHKPAEVPGATVEPFAVPRAAWTNPRRWDARRQRYLRSFAQRFDAVHIHFLHDWGFTGEMLDEGCFVVTPWGSDIVPPPGEGLPTEPLRAARIMMLRSARLVTAWGHWFAGAVARFAGLDASTIERLPLGVDLELFRPMVQTRRDARSGHRVGFFKGFREVYGAAYLLRAAPTVLEEFPHTQFHLIGDGPQLEECKVLAGRLGVDFATTWISRQAHRNLPSHLAGWDVTAIPSLCESFGAAALESAAMEVPVVATAVGGLPETVRDGETGLLVPPAAPEQLADAIIRLLGDGGLRKRMGSASRAMVAREYEWGAILDRWVEVYAKVIGTGEGVRREVRGVREATGSGKNAENRNAEIRNEGSRSECQDIETISAIDNRQSPFGDRQSTRGNPTSAIDRWGVNDE